MATANKDRDNQQDALVCNEGKEVNERNLIYLAAKKKLRIEEIDLGNACVMHKQILEMIDELDTDVKTLKQDTSEIKQEVSQVKQDTQGLIETFRSFQGFIKVIEFLYSISKPIMWFLFVCASLYYLMMGIKLPIPKA